MSASWTTRSASAALPATWTLTRPWDGRISAAYRAASPSGRYARTVTGVRRGTSAEPREQRVLGREIDVAPVETFAEVPVERLGEAGGERVGGAEPQLRAQPRRRVDGMAVVGEILAEGGLGVGRAGDQRERTLDDIGDDLDEPCLGDRLLAGDVVGAPERAPDAEHGGHRVGEILDVADLTEPAPRSGQQHRPAPHEPVEEERLVVAGVHGAVDVGRPHEGHG